MKNTRQEWLKARQRIEHRRNRIPPVKDGVFHIDDSSHLETDGLSLYADIGLVLNDCEVTVWWRHPRHVYREEIETFAMRELGPGPEEGWLHDVSGPNHAPVGKSRKRIVSYTTNPPSEAQRDHYDRIDALMTQYREEGIDLQVRVSCRRKRWKWATNISIVAPFEIQSLNDVLQLADLAKKLIAGEASIQSMFPGYAYGREDWLREKNGLPE